MIDERKTENPEPDGSGATARPGESGLSITNHQPPTTNHSIRLRGFWESATDGARTTHSRRFGRPRTLGEGERVWLVCSSLPGPVEVSVNGRVVAAAAATPVAVDVTDHLQARNTVQLAAASAEPPGDVWLEIRRPPG